MTQAAFLLFVFLKQFYIKSSGSVMEKNDTVYNLTESIESVLERYNKLKEQDVVSIIKDKIAESKEMRN